MDIIVDMVWHVLISRHGVCGRPWALLVFSLVFILTLALGISMPVGGRMVVLGVAVPEPATEDGGGGEYAAFACIV